MIFGSASTLSIPFWMLSVEHLRREYDQKFEADPRRLNKIRDYTDLHIIIPQTSCASEQAHPEAIDQIEGTVMPIHNSLGPRDLLNSPQDQGDDTVEGSK